MVLKVVKVIQLVETEAIKGLVVTIGVTSVVVISELIKNKSSNSEFDRLNDENETSDKIDCLITEDSTQSIERSSQD